MTAHSKPVIKPPDWTQCPNVFFDSILKSLSGAETKICCVVMRETFGWHLKTANKHNLSLSYLAQQTGLARNTVLDATNSLCEDSDVRCAILGRKKKGNKSYSYYLLMDTSRDKELTGHVFAPADSNQPAMKHGRLPAMKHGRYHLKKHVLKKGSPSSSGPSRIKQDDDGSKSRFSLETIRTYVQRLRDTKRRSVRSIEGLAQSIFHSGVDDALIADWLAEGTEDDQIVKDPYLPFRVIVGSSLSLAKIIKAKGAFRSEQHQDYRLQAKENGIVSTDAEYWLLHELAVLRLRNEHMGLPDEVIEQKRAEWRKVG